jgi:hypothetical protein
MSLWMLRLQEAPAGIPLRIHLSFMYSGTTGVVQMEEVSETRSLSSTRLGFIKQRPSPIEAYTVRQFERESSHRSCTIGTVTPVWTTRYQFQDLQAAYVFVGILRLSVKRYHWPVDVRARKDTTLQLFSCLCKVVQE